MPAVPAGPPQDCATLLLWCKTPSPPNPNPNPHRCPPAGSRDTNVMVWDPVTAASVQTLAGHSYQVTAVGVLPDGTLASGSLDKTLKLWHGGKCIQTLEGHGGPVLCMAVLPDGDILSGSGDMTVRRWSRGQCVATFKGHTDTVRQAFVSCFRLAASHPVKIIRSSKYCCLGFSPFLLCLGKRFSNAFVLLLCLQPALSHSAVGLDSQCKRLEWT